MSNVEIETICNSGVQFKYDKRGRKSAWYYSFKAMRNIRIPLEIAETLVATEQAEDVTTN